MWLFHKSVCKLRHIQYSRRVQAQWQYKVLVRVPYDPRNHHLHNLERFSQRKVSPIASEIIPERKKFKDLYVRAYLQIR